MEHDIYGQLVERLAAGQRVALATMIESRGSVPQRTGAKALIDERGVWAGTVGGGLLEEVVRRRALELLPQRQSDLIAISLDANPTEPAGICGGNARVFVCVPGPDRADLLRTAAQAWAERRGAAVVTCVAGPPQQLGRQAVATDGGGSVGEAELARIAERALRERQGGVQPWGEGEVFVDLVVPRPRLWIVGCGHVGRALAKHASACEFEVFALDDRADFCSADNIPWAEHHLVGDVAATLAEQAFGPDDFIVLVTRGHLHDAAALRQVVRARPRYLGMIGSRRKVRLVFDKLLAAGDAGEDDLALVYAPIGLDLGSITVDEIAVAMTAELVGVRRGRITSPRGRALATGGWSAGGEA